MPNKAYRLYCYQVQPCAGGKIVQTDKSRKHRTLYLELVAGELLSYKRARRYNIPEQYLKKVSVTSTSVYWFFGARFSSELD